MCFGLLCLYGGWSPFSKKKGTPCHHVVTKKGEVFKFSPLEGSSKETISGDSTLDLLRLAKANANLNVLNKKGAGKS